MFDYILDTLCVTPVSIFMKQEIDKLVSWYETAVFSKKGMNYEFDRISWYGFYCPDENSIHSKEFESVFTSYYPLSLALNLLVMAKGR